MAASPQRPELPQRQTHNKLVRDRIPHILSSHHISFALTEMTETDYRQALRHKLIEEATEAAEATEADFVMELADLYEVIDAALAAYGLQREQVLACQQQRRQARGGFSQRLRLLWTEE